jgi:NAD(P)-dependent dehydrogenase (short-subunit alcohol dehydrogenase family)
MWRLDGKVAVVTGAGGVLAGCMANGLAVAGADIAVLDVNEENALRRAKEIGKLGRRALAVKADVGDKGQLQRAADEIEAKLGPVDILINGAGTNSSTPFFEITEEEYDRILGINLKGAFLACQVFGQRMADRGQGGSIINISSASSGIPLSRVFTYSVSKAGINSLTQYLAREFAPYRIRVNAIAPGFFPAEQNRKILTRTVSRTSCGTPRWVVSANPKNCSAPPCGWPPRRRPPLSPAQSSELTAASPPPPYSGNGPTVERKGDS